MRKTGWLKEQFDDARIEVESWPTWMQKLARGPVPTEEKVAPKEAPRQDHEKKRENKEQK